MENGKIVKKTTEYADGAIISKQDEKERTGFFTLKYIQVPIRAANGKGGWGEAIPIREKVPRLVSEPAK
jgi:hypothetical protein